MTSLHATLGSDFSGGTPFQPSAPVAVADAGTD
jgi:hypothetical protein